MAGPCREGEEPKPVMDESKKSDLAVVALKPTNKTGSLSVAEPVEPRAGTEGNVNQQSTHWAQIRLA
jgi:RNA-directed DNA polymerase